MRRCHRQGRRAIHEEWLVYDRLLGVDHFVLSTTIQSSPSVLLSAYESFVTVIDSPTHRQLARRNLQIKTYTHALACQAASYTWATFLDPDEFIVLRKHGTLRFFFLPSRTSEACA